MMATAHPRNVLHLLHAADALAADALAAFCRRFVANNLALVMRSDLWTHPAALLDDLSREVAGGRAALAREPSADDDDDAASDAGGGGRPAARLRRRRGGGGGGGVRSLRRRWRRRPGGGVLVRRGRGGARASTPQETEADQRSGGADGNQEAVSRAAAKVATKASAFARSSRG